MAEGKAGGVGSGRPVFDPNKMYNVTQEEMQALQERAKMREAMKQEFRKKASNPYRGAGGYIVSDLHLFGMTFDVCMYVFYSCRIDQQTLKLNVKLLYVRGCSGKFLGNSFRDLGPSNGGACAPAQGV